MEVSETLEDIEIVFRHLAFTIKMLSFCELGNINPKDFDTHHTVMLEAGGFDHSLAHRRADESF